MKHYQKEYKCSVCNRELVVDILNFGIPHETIQAITCKECGIKVGGNILGNKVEDLEFEKVDLKVVNNKE